MTTTVPMMQESTSQAMSSAAEVSWETSPSREELNDVGIEIGTWLQHVSDHPQQAAWPCHDLLRRGALELPGNLRYARDLGQTLLIGDVPISPESEEPLGDARRRLHGYLRQATTAPGGGDAAPAPDNDLLGSLLSESGFAFERREPVWTLPAETGRPQVTLSAVTGGACVESVLANWESIEDVSRDALALYLCRMHRCLRFCRFVMNEHDVRVASLAESTWIETDLIAGVHAVVAAAARVGAAAGALRSSALARTFLQTYSP